MPRSHFVTVYLILNVVFLAALILLLRGEGFSPVETAEIHSVIVLHQQKIPREEATSYCVTESRIFINYENNRLVNVYTSSGEFQYGIVYGDYSNGHTVIGYDEQRDMLYILARGSIVYGIAGTELTECFEYSQDPVEYRRIESQYVQGKHRNRQGEYGLTDQGILLSDGNGQRLIIAFPQKDQSVETWLILFALFQLGFVSLKRTYVAAE